MGSLSVSGHNRSPLMYSRKPQTLNVSLMLSCHDSQLSSSRRSKVLCSPNKSLGQIHITEVLEVDIDVGVAVGRSSCIGAVVDDDDME